MKQFTFLRPLALFFLLLSQLSVGCASLDAKSLESHEPSLQKSQDPDQRLLLDEQFLKKSRAVGVLLPANGDRKLRRSLRP